MRRNRGAARQQINLIVNIRRPPGVAPTIDLERQPRVIFKAVTRADFLNADALRAQLSSPSHSSERNFQWPGLQEAEGSYFSGVHLSRITFELLNAFFGPLAPRSFCHASCESP